MPAPFSRQRPAMPEFTWELRRRKDGFVVDRAHQARIMRRAGMSSMGYVGSSKNLGHQIVHVPTGTVVGSWGNHPGAGGWGWRLDEALVEQLEQ